MSAVLIITKNKRHVAKVALARPTFVIGRSSQCDLTLDEALASRHHAEITLAQGRHHLRDCESRNGTLLNGHRLTGPTLLNDGDDIVIGATSLKYATEAADDLSPPDSGESATRPASSSASDFVSPGPQAQAAPGARAAAPLPQAGLNLPSSRLRVALKVVDGPFAGGIYRDWEGPLTVGRALENNVVLLDDAVSSRHARIVREGGLFFLEDLESINGTFVDGVKIRRHPLHDGQRLRIGASTLAFECVDLGRRRRQLQIALGATVVLALVLLVIKLFQPPDLAGQHIAAARQYEAAGKLAQAQAAYEEALRVEDGRAEAEQGLRQVKAALQAGETVGRAEDAAAAEQYDRARDLCNQVLRTSPNHPRARQLDEVITAIEDARVAFKARNWADASRLLERAREKYPASQLIALRLQEAQAEIAAAARLAKARDALEHRQTDLAELQLTNIPSSSVLFPEACSLLEGISRDRQTAGSLARAQELCREGQLAEALATLETALQLAPQDARLTDLRARVRELEPRLGPLAAAEALPATSSVESLLAGRAACERVIELEPDPLSALRKRAIETRARLDQRLQALAREAAAQAETLRQAGQRREALHQLEQAVKAAGTDPEYARAAATLRQQIVADCQKTYLEGLALDELGQNDLAREKYRHVLDIGLPGERYHDLAARKLK